MTCNMGTTDRALRLGAGRAAASATGYCPACEPLGLDTRDAAGRARDAAEG